MSKIHPTAIVENKAKIAEDVEIGPYCIIGPEVQIGKGTVLDTHVRIKGRTKIGENNKIFHSALIGEIPQDFTFNNPEAEIVIGNDNTFREFTCIHLPCRNDKPTRIGNNNFMMNHSHIGHDAAVGNNVIIVSYVPLAGHTVVEDHAYLGGLSAVVQYCRIGAYAITGGLTKVAQDVPPFVLCEGNPAKAHSLNTVGMKRRGFKPETRQLIKKAFHILYREKLPVRQAVETIKSDILSAQEPDSEGYEKIKMFTDFIEASEKGIIGFSEKTK